MEEYALSLDGLGVTLSGNRVLHGIDLRLPAGGCLAVIGRTGAGKTTLLKALCGGLHHSGTVHFAPVEGRRPRLELIARQHPFRNLSNLPSFYYQQRFNSNDTEDARTVGEELLQTAASGQECREVLGMLGIATLWDTRLIQLSNGEHKRFQIAEAMLRKADWLLLDNPYVGLDSKARGLLNRLVDALVAGGTRVLLASGTEDLPDAVTHVACLEQGRFARVLSGEAHRRQSGTQPAQRPGLDAAGLRNIPPAYEYPGFRDAVRMSDVHIRYGGRAILDGVDWVVAKGECWSLSGPNGSGKSTLLSLVTGDNPQAFANRVHLFDRRKGSGESIWDIKRMIGYVSPEMHHYLSDDGDCFGLVASGLFDTMGLFRQPNAAQTAIVQKWMAATGTERFARRRFRSLSDGEQRLVLLTRALVKHPPMLILDEPCQGLDAPTTAYFNAIVDAVCTATGKTLVYVSHYASDIPACVTHHLRLEGGRVAR